MTRRIAHNRCIRCKTEWKDLPGAWAAWPSCPSCGFIYYEWLNYEKDWTR